MKYMTATRLNDLSCSRPVQGLEQLICGFIIHIVLFKFNLIVKLFFLSSPEKYAQTGGSVLDRFWK